MTNPEVSIVVPLYNEAEVFNELIKRVNSTIQSFPSLSIEVILVDDGSKDGTTEMIESVVKEQNGYTGIILSRNFGHQIALSAGLAEVQATKYIMVIDGDLQDPPEMLKEFIEKSQEGYDVVFGVRKKRKASPLKKLAYWSYYRMIRGVSSIDVPLDSGDFCLMSREVVNHLNQMPEKDRYIRGMRTWVGYKQVGLEYERPERFAGETKYSWSLLFRLAFSGLFNFSRKPIQFITRLGAIFFALSTTYLLYTVYSKYVLENTPSGFTAVIGLIIALSSLQFVALGVIGEYVYRSFELVQRRPNYITKRILR